MSKVTIDDRDDIERRLASGESLRAIAKSYDVTYQTLQYHRRRWGCEPLREARTSGESHTSWNGGWYIDRWGYKMIRAPHRDTSNPYSAEHVLVAEKMLGRQLKKNQEVVHHINGNPLDNRPENLVVCTRSEHKKLHNQLEKLAFEFLSEGLILFENGEYKRA